MSDPLFCTFLRSPEKATFGRLSATGATRASDHEEPDFRSLEIPLPPLDEQRRIAAILDKADALRRKRKRAIDLLDSLTQSIFLEMFGDPIDNPTRLRSRKLGAIARSNVVMDRTLR